MGKKNKKKKQKTSGPVKVDGQVIKTIATNRKARFEYHVLEDLEAGIMLVGSEVKSVRDGRVSFQDAYARFIQGELFLVNFNIAEYKNANIQNHDPTRKRKLLLHKRELNKLYAKVRESGYTLVPLSMYFKGSLVKIKLGLCRGKQEFDKRETVKKRETEREMERYKRKH